MMNADEIRVERRAFRLAEIAEAYGLSLGFIKKERRLGRLHAKRVGGAVIVLKRDLDAWLEQQDQPDQAL